MPEPTQLFGAGQEALLVRQDVVEDEKLRSDGVALPHSAAAALPLLARHTQSNTGMSYTTAAQLDNQSINGRFIENFDYNGLN